MNEKQLFGQVFCCNCRDQYYNIISKKQGIILMICSIDEKHCSLSRFRLWAVRKILRLGLHDTGIQRRQLFLAITVLDQALITLTTQPDQFYSDSDEMKIPFCIACLKLACKFQSQKNPKIDNLALLLNENRKLENLEALCMQAEMKVLTLLNFQMPCKTFYNALEDMDWQSYLTLKQIAFFFKIFSIGIQYSTEMTQRLDLGKRLYQHLKLKCRHDETIQNYFQVLAKWSKKVD